MAEKRRREDGGGMGGDLAAQALPLVLKVLESPQVREKPPGTFVIVNIGTGEFVTAATLIDANDIFQEKFPEAIGFAHRVGEPLFEPLWD